MYTFFRFLLVKHASLNDKSHIVFVFEQILTECWNSSVAILWNTIQIQCRTCWLPHRLGQVDQFRSFPAVLTAWQTSLTEIGLFSVELPPLKVPASDFLRAHLIGVRQSLLNSVRIACVGNSFEPLSATAMAELNAQKSQKLSAQSVHFVSSPLVALMNKVNANFFGTAPADALTDAAGARVSGGIPQVVWLLYASAGHCVEAANALDQSRFRLIILGCLGSVFCFFKVFCFEHQFGTSSDHIARCRLSVRGGLSILSCSRAGSFA
jgi:hypothetical protein